MTQLNREIPIIKNPDGFSFIELTLDEYNSLDDYSTVTPMIFVGKNPKIEVRPHCKDTLKYTNMIATVDKEGAMLTKPMATDDVEHFNPKPLLHFLFAAIIWFVVYFVTKSLVTPNWHLIIGYTTGMINGIILAKGWMQ